MTYTRKPELFVKGISRLPAPPLSRYLVFMFWLFLTALIVVKSPLGKALADRLAGRYPEGDGHLESDLEPIVHQLEDRVLDLEERLEFAERLIQQQKERDRLQAGG